ncbi:MAG: HAD family hydrolase [Bacteroidales bacterium]|nr:HAD family hydrolase [Bacteroidales bacterium]
MKRGETIIWDWNGTLLDDVDICIECINRMLDVRGRNRITKEAYLKLFRFPVIDFYTDLGFDFTTENFDVLSNEYITHYTGIESQSSLQDGALNLLKNFHTNHIYQIVLSAMEQRILTRSVKKHNIHHYFREIVGTRNFYGHGKLELAQQYIKRSSLSPCKITMLGDTIHDHEVAKALGCHCVLISCGHQPYEKLKQTGGRVEKNLAALFDLITIS